MTFVASLALGLFLFDPELIGRRIARIVAAYRKASPAERGRTMIALLTAMLFVCALFFVAYRLYVPAAVIGSTFAVLVFLELCR